MCMSVRALQAQYAAEFGHSVAEEIRQARLEQVKELLRDTNLSISQIATRVGYGSGFYLADFFCRRTRLTPSEYRRRQRARK